MPDPVTPVLQRGARPVRDVALRAEGQLQREKELLAQANEAANRGAGARDALARGDQYARASTMAEAARRPLPAGSYAHFAGDLPRAREQYRAAVLSPGISPKDREAALHYLENLKDAGSAKRELAAEKKRTAQTGAQVQAMEKLPAADAGALQRVDDDTPSLGPWLRFRSAK